MKTENLVLLIAVGVAGFLVLDTIKQRRPADTTAIYDPKLMDNPSPGFYTNASFASTTDRILQGGWA